jgi:methionyl-tRNA formyltransferase
MLYQRLFELEQQVFEEAWPAIVQGTARCAAQDHAQATCHKKRDLHQPAVQAIDLSETVQAGAFLRKLRALTTNRVDEAAYFDSDGHRYRVRVNISREEIPPQ